jgi:hypothetical protein
VGLHPLRVRFAKSGCAVSTLKDRIPLHTSRIAVRILEIYVAV